MTKQSNIEEIEIFPSAQKNTSNHFRKPLDQNWEFRQVGQDTWYQAHVPGCNFTDLFQNGLIDDPFFKDNEEKLQWIEKEAWEYKTIVTLTKEELNFMQIDLVLEGLDTYADVFINENKVLSADNMFVTWKQEVKRLFRSGQNELKIFFHSPIKFVAQKAKESGLLYPAGNDQSEENLSVYSRKAPYHFGWDWGPRFVTSGVWRPIYLEFHDRIKINELHFDYDIDVHNDARVCLNLNIEALHPGDISLTVDCLNEQLNTIYHRHSLKDGDNHIKIYFSIHNCKRWWTYALGEPFLYLFNITINDNGNRPINCQKQVGFRDIEVVNEPDADGESFYLKLNGTPIFIKGANYIPQNSFLNKVASSHYHKLFEDVKAANMNMLRIWGGGIYECNLFYEIADESGVLIWQDFMFACTYYPGDKAFLSSVKKEAVQNILRLKGHASLALWCGNNEIKVGSQHWQWEEIYGYSKEDLAKLDKDYDELFETLLPTSVATHDPKRFYFPSSPISNFESEKDYTIGDMHYWGVWHGEAPFEDYEKCIPRFMSEYGFQSFPIFKSVKKYTETEDWDIESKVMKLHQRHPKGNELIWAYLLRDFHRPNDFESLLYVSQVLQGMGLKMAMEAHRRAKPYCMGTLYWQLNDCWPVASWSGIDYYGQWKALHYYAKHAYQEILVSITKNGDNIEFHVISDKLMDQTAVLSIKAAKLDGSPIFNESCEIIVKANSSQIVKTYSQETLIGECNIGDVFVSADLKPKAAEESRNAFYFVPPKALNLSKANVEKEIMILDNKIKIKLKSGHLVKNLYLWFDQFEGNFSDNFFDLLPNQQQEISLVVENGTIEKLPTLNMISLVDTY